MPANTRCRACRLSYATKKDGNIRAHGNIETPDGWAPCPGARRPPLGVPDPDDLPGDGQAYRDERDALMALIIQPWYGEGDGSVKYRVNLAWWDTAGSYEEAVRMVREAAGLPVGREEREVAHVG